MVAQGVMGRAPTHGFAHRDAFQIKLIGHRAHAGLGALVVDVPALKVLQRRRIHDDQGWVNDGACIHQRTRQGVATGMHAGVGPADDGQGLIGMDRWVNAGGQVHGADGEVDLAGAMLARQIRHGAGFCPAHIGQAPQGTHAPGHGEAAKGAGGQKHHLPVLQIRGHGLGDVILSGGGGGQQNQLRPAQGQADVGADAVDGHIAFTLSVFEMNAAVGQERRQSCTVTPPQTNLVPRQGQICGGRISPVSPSEHSNFHGVFQN